MQQFIVAVGLVFAIEGLLMAGFTETMKRRMAEVARLEPGRLRGIGLGAAVFGVLVVWAARSMAF